MLFNYLRVALRVLRRSPGYSAINVLGLSLGLALSIVMLLFVRHEWSYDTFHENADEIYRLYRVEHRVRTPMKVSEATMTPLAPVVQDEIPGVKAVTRVATSTLGVEVEPGSVTSLEVAYVDPVFLDMFDFGAGGSDLRDPGTVILTRSAVERLFGPDVPASLTMLVGNGEETATLSAVIPDPPRNSSIRFEVLRPYQEWPNYPDSRDNWDSFSAATFVQLDAGTPVAALDAGLRSIVSQYYSETIQRNIEEGWWADREDTFTLNAQPLNDVHLSPRIDSFNLEISNPRHAYILLGIAVIVLLIACANFMALAVGRSLTRAREVGTRKALGASRRQVALQFWGEAILLSLIAAVIGMVLADLFMPVFNRLAGQDLIVSYSAGDLLMVLGLAVLVGLIAGSYPAAILSGMRPTSVLSGGGSGPRGVRFSRAVIVFQFAAAIAMIATTLVMYRQLEFISQRDLGFKAEEVLVVPLRARDASPQEVHERFSPLAMRIPAVIETSASSTAFGGSWSRTVVPQGEQNHIVYMNYVEPSFLNTLGIDLVAGRNLSLEFETDRENAILVNQAFVDAFGWEDPLGQSVDRWPDVRVVGVVENFHQLSLHQEIPPTVLHMSTRAGSPNYTLVRFDTDDTAGVLRSLEAAWEQVAPGSPFEAEFMDQRLQALYEAERRWQEVAGYAALFAVLISCLGLFGVATLTVNRRRKEIGVRKVFGASSGSLAALVSRDFALLVGLAFAVGAPVAWLFSERWLETFAYQVSISPLIFVAAGVLALGLALATVSYQAVRAARANPTETLRYE